MAIKSSIFENSRTVYLYENFDLSTTNLKYLNSDENYFQQKHFIFKFYHCSIVRKMIFVYSLIIFMSIQQLISQFFTIKKLCRPMFCSIVIYSDHIILLRQFFIKLELSQKYTAYDFSGMTNLVIMTDKYTIFIQTQFSNLYLSHYQKRHFQILLIFALQLVQKEINSLRIMLKQINIQQFRQQNNPCFKILSYHISSQLIYKFLLHQIIIFLAIASNRPTMEESSYQIIRTHKINAKSLTIEDCQNLPQQSPKKIFSDIKQQSKKYKIIFLEQEQVRKSLTQRVVQEVSQVSDSDMGSEWANWNINQVKIHPPNLIQQAEQFDIADKFRRRKSRSIQKKSKSPQKVTKQSVKQNDQKQNAQKEIRRIMINRVLAGKGSYIWLFVLGKKISEAQISPIKNIYKDYPDNDYVSPLCRSFEEAKRFLKIENCFFKIITDLQNSWTVAQQSIINPKVISIYLYTNKKQRGASQIFQLKRKTKKVKGVYLSLSQAADQVFDDLVQQAKFIDVNNNLQRASNFRFRFPVFLVLSGKDNSQVTNYRLCLYASIKLQSKNQKASYLKEFTDMVEMRYSNDPKQLTNLDVYKSIDHFAQNSPQKAQQIIKFYVKQNFYYSMINSLLRLARSSQQFRPCMIPFKETYEAIRYYHRLTKNERTSFRAYRGAKLRSSEVSSLAIGSYIQMLGFTSSSLNKSVAMKFMDDDSYLIQIIVNEQEHKKPYTDGNYEHGFVQINKHGLAEDSFSSQQQVLFNALNVYQVVTIDLKSAIRTIVLKYGALTDLKQQQKNQLSQKQRIILNNMQYCFSKFNSIEDDGDILLLSQQHEKAKQYYIRKIRQGESNPKHHAKLANIQSQLGNLVKAQHHALQMLNFLKSDQLAGARSSILYQNIDTTASILSLTQNIEGYEQFIDCQLKLSNDCFQKCQSLMQRARNKLKRGQFNGCISDILLADYQLQHKKASFQKRRVSISRSYFFKIACSCLIKQNSATLQAERNAELLNLQQQQINFKANIFKFSQLKIQIEKIKSQYLQIVGDYNKIDECYDNMKKYFSNLCQKNQQINPFQAAKYYQMEAITNKKRDFSEYQILMETAIDILRQSDPYHRQIGRLSLQLASERHSRLRKTLTFSDLISEGSGSSKSSHNDNSKIKKKYKQQFNYQNHKKTYKKCRHSYTQAINISLYHNGQQHPQYLSTENKLSQLNLDYSLLKQAQDSAMQVSKKKMSSRHSEGAKSYLLLAKVSLARGQLKRSFKMIDNADKILNIALCPKDTRTFIIKHPLFAQINLIKAKIFNQQARHDIALRELNILQKIADDLPASQQLKAKIRQQKAEIYFSRGQKDQFEQQILKAIKQRQKVMGKYNINNAINLQKLSMSTHILNDEKNTLNYHSKAIEIFSRFPVDHPNSWIIHLTNATIFEGTKAPQSIVQQLQLCLKVAERRYSLDNINLAKIQIKVGELYRKMKLQHKALDLYELIDKNMQKQIKVSNAYQRIDREIDDQKIIIRKKILKDLQYLYNQVKGDQLAGIIGAQRCKDHIKHFHFNFSEDKIESLKSLE